MSGQYEMTGLLEALKDRHGFDEWRGVNRLEEQLFVWRFFLSGNELPGWRPERIRSLEASTGLPPSIRSMWRRDEKDESPVSLDVFECPSRVEAHETVIRLLTEFQSADVARNEELGVGDIAFAMPGYRSVLFSRANVVVLARNAGPAPTSVAEATAAIDGTLAARPDEGGVVVPEIRVLRMAETRVAPGTATRLEVAAADPLGRPVWYRFFSRVGEVTTEAGEPVYRSTTPGEDRLTIVATNENGGVATAVTDVVVE